MNAKDAKSSFIITVIRNILIGILFHLLKDICSVNLVSKTTFLTQ